MRSTINRTLVIGATILLGTFGQAAGPLTSKASAAPPATPPDVESQAFGSSYGEWSARWWQWLLSIPAAVNPNLDTTGANCAQGQSANVWFLAGTFGGSAARTCTVPAGKALFFPMINNVAFQPNTTDTLNSLRSQAAGLIDNVSVTSLICSIDGKRCALDLSLFRVTSPSFSVIVPPNGLIAPDSYNGATNPPFVSDGYWMFLAPLPTGQHVINFGGTSSGGFTVNVTYNLTVQ
jgi:hypothetical protein